MKKIVLIFVVLIAVILSWVYLDNIYFEQKNEEELIERVMESQNNSNNPTQDIPNSILPLEEVVDEPTDELAENVPVPLPAKIKINVPFTAQAPFGVWDARHEDACEEASLLMVVKYLRKEKLTAEIAEKELQNMIDFQIKERGYFEDSNMEELVRLAIDFYNIDNLKVVYDFEKDELKKELAKGNPIIVPAAGRLLGNPNFTPPGPLYHNLVLIGYDGDKIITNDPGTKRGEDYIYDLDSIYEAIHDFTGKKEDIENGRKAMIVVESY